MVNDEVKTIPWELILKRLKNAAGEDERIRLNLWIKADDRHRRLWNELQQAWNDVCQLNSGFNPDKSRAWKKVVGKIRKQYQKPIRSIPVHWQVAAACILVLFGVATGTRFKTSTEPSPVTYTQYQTQYGKSFVTLPDGTQVWLNARTSLRLSNRFNENERQVQLNGEALFNVAKNQNIPFLVDIKDIQVRVHGTKFNVYAYDNKPEATVSLIEGSVSLSAAGCPNIRLEPGNSSVYSHADKKLYTKTSDRLVTLWAGNELRIEDKSLAETARLLESWYHLKVDVTPALQRTQHYTFTVRHESPAELLAAMQKIGKFRYRIDENKITIY